MVNGMPFIMRDVFDYVDFCFEGPDRLVRGQLGLYAVQGVAPLCLPL